MNDTKNCRIVFLHIPRTSGTTLRMQLTRWAQNNGLAVSAGDFSESLDSANIDQEQLKIWVQSNCWQEADVIMGHLPYGSHQYDCRETLYLSMVRHPVTHTISMWRKRQRHGRGQGKFWGSTWDQLIFDIVKGRFPQNPQSRQLSGLAHAVVGCMERRKEYLRKLEDIGIDLPEHDPEEVMPYSGVPPKRVVTKILKHQQEDLALWKLVNAA